MLFQKMAGLTGLEPATSGVTGRHSNQLNYHPDNNKDSMRKMSPRALGEWWAEQGSNLRPVACKATALPTELSARKTENSASSKGYDDLFLFARPVKAL